MLNNPLLYAYESKQKQGQNPDSLNPDGTMWSFENTVWNLENEAVFRQWVNVKVDHLCNDQRMHDLIHMSYFWLYVQGGQTHRLLLTMRFFCLCEVNFCGVIIHNFPSATRQPHHVDDVFAICMCPDEAWALPMMFTDRFQVKSIIENHRMIKTTDCGTTLWWSHCDEMRDPLLDK